MQLFGPSIEVRSLVGGHVVIEVEVLVLVVPEMTVVVCIVVIHCTGPWAILPVWSSGELRLSANRVH